MKYYLLSGDFDQAGRTPQSNGIIGEYNFYWPNALYRISSSRKKVEEVKLPEGIKLHYRAKFTDMLILSIISFPFVVCSKKFFAVLQQFDLPECNTQSIKVVKRSREENYVFSYTNHIAYEILDFKQTQFAWESEHRGRYELLDINSAKEYIHLHEDSSNSFIRIVDSPILRSFEGQADLIRLPQCCLIHRYLVSERLIEKLVSEQLTGFKFELFNSKILDRIPASRLL